MAEQAFNISYNSGITIPDRGELASLCIFYDQLTIPYIPDYAAGIMLQFRRRWQSSDPFVYTSMWRRFKFLSKEHAETDSERYIEQWDSDNALLYQEGVLTRAARPTNDAIYKYISEAYEQSNRLNEIFGNINTDLLSTYFLWDKTEKLPVNEEWGGRQEFLFVWLSHAAHLLRTDLSGHGLFFPTRSRRREFAKALIAETVIRFVLPKVAALHPDQILAVRESVSATREGFALHLQQLTSNIENAIINQSYAGISVYKNG